MQFCKMNLLVVITASFLLAACLQHCKANTTQFDASNLTEVQFTFRGTPGRDGRDGLVGPKGPPGPLGPAGPPGVVGPAGPQGGVGPVGPRGDQGSPGSPGLPGPQGVGGPTGPQGYTGPPGQSGPPGAEGPAGKRGVDGSPGPQGPRGPPGLPGITVLDSNAESRIKSEIQQKVTDEINNGLVQRMEREQKLGLSYDYPAEGCEEIARNNPQKSEGWYWVRDSSDNSTRKVYCYPCGHPTCGEGVWMRIGYFDMRGNLAECPKPLERFAVNRVWYCRRAAPPCTSVYFSTLQKKYTSVCGKVEAYQYGNTDGFSHSTATKTPDDFYVDGISITHGSSPRRHIWTYAVGLNANPAAGYHLHGQCPCTVAGSSRTRPSFLGNDYYCDSGNPSRNSLLNDYLYTNGLWDNHGSSCITGSTCCDNPDQPWFKKKWTQPTDGDVELRWCGSEPVSREATATSKVELYVRIE